MEERKRSNSPMTRNEFATTVRTEIRRLEQTLLDKTNRPIKGCDAGDHGCCECMQAMEKDPEINEIINHHPEILHEYIESNKEPLRKFFEKKGIILKK